MDHDHSHRKRNDHIFRLSPTNGLRKRFLPPNIIFIVIQLTEHANCYDD